MADVCFERLPAWVTYLEWFLQGFVIVTMVVPAGVFTLLAVLSLLRTMWINFKEKEQDE
jgi:hypothetical protein